MSEKIPLNIFSKYEKNLNTYKKLNILKDYTIIFIKTDFKKTSINKLKESI